MVSELALQALQHVIGLARAGLAVELVLANVQEPASAYELLTLHDPEALAEVAVGAGRDLMAPAVALADASGLPYAETVVVGDVVPALLELLGRRAATPSSWAAMAWGWCAARWARVSRGMLEDAPVPVTFVKAPRTGRRRAEAED